MSRRSDIAPYRQGQLDGLCGLYAIINAIRLATHDRTDEFGHEVWRDLLLALLGEAENVVGTATAVVHGIGTKPLYELAKAAERHLASEHGLALTVTRQRGPKHSFDGLIAHLAELTKQPGSAVVMELSGDVRHWTVLRRVGKHSLELFDSSGMERVKLTSCRLKHEWSHNGSREYILRRRRVILISVDQTSPEARGRRNARIRTNLLGGWYRNLKQRPRGIRSGKTQHPSMVFHESSRDGEAQPHTGPCCFRRRLLKRSSLTSGTFDQAPHAAYE